MADQRDAHPEDIGTAAYQEQRPAGKAGRYAIRKFHARGGMGEVWQAEDADIGRLVALKRLRGERADQKARFLAEAQITGQLEHPGIVPVHDLGTDEDDRPFYIMSFVGGRTLKDAIADFFAASKDGRAGDRHGAEPREVQRRRLLEAFVQVCRTIAYAHSKGVLHRDLKPDNIMLGPFGETIVLDWGLAKVQGRPEEPAPAGYVRLSYEGTSTATQYGTVIGAPPYMAPEVAAGKATEADERTDVYLLGGTLYEILTGRAPRQGSSKSEIIELARTVPPVAPRQLNRTVEPALNAICMRALAQRKQDRYASAAELAQEVERYLAGEPVSAYREGLPARTWRWCKRHRRALAYSAVGMLVLGLVAAGYAVVDTANRRSHEAMLAAADLQKREDARAQVQRFRRLADELHFQAANVDALHEKTPYYDLSHGAKAGQDALAIAQSWGPHLEELPLADERPALEGELYAVLLLLAQVQTHRQQPAPEVHDLLDRAETVSGRSRSLHRLRAESYDRQADRKRGETERRLAEDGKTPETALDCFLKGEKHRIDSALPEARSAEQLGWRPSTQQLTDAIAQYRAALALQPGHYWAHFQLGRCLLSLGQADEAVMALGACVALRPKAPWGWSTRGLAQTVRGKYALARADLDKALEADPDFQPALLYGGVLHWKQKQFDKALADFAAVPLAEGDYYRGQVLLEQGKHAEALRAFNRLATAQPTFWPVHLLRARACFALGENKEGLAALDAFLAGTRRFDPQSAQGYEVRGTLLRRLLARESVPATRKRLAQLTLEQLQEAEKRGPVTAEFCRELGAMFDNPKQATRAIDYYTRGLKLAPEHSELHLLRGAAYTQHRQDYKSGMADFTAALEVADDHPDAWKVRAEAHGWLGFIHARQQAVAEAEAQAALALLHGHSDGRTTYLLYHNVACIFAELSLCDAPRAKAHQDVCLAHLERAMTLAQRVGKGPRELEEIRNEPSFRSLQNLPRLQRLLATPRG